jgi:hypothetical protein
VCREIPGGLTRITGWIDGTRAETLPKSVDAASSLGTTARVSTVRPSSACRTAHRAVNGWLNRIGSEYGDGSQSTSTLVPVDRALPRAMSSTRRLRSFSVSTAGERR